MDREGAARRLRQVGLRVTAPRLAVLAALASEPHLPVEVIARGARDRLGTLSVQAVYDNLEVLVRAGLVRRIEPAGSPARFELRVGDNHHHLVCRQCGAVRDVDCVIGAAPCLTPAESHGYLVDEAEVIFWGRCERCQTSLLRQQTSEDVEAATSEPLPDVEGKRPTAIHEPRPPDVRLRHDRAPFGPTE